MAKDFSINFEAMNESGTRAFFRQKLVKRQKSFIRILKSRKGPYLSDSFSIENEFHDVYREILEGQDPFDPELFYDFIADCRNHFKQIPDQARTCIEGEITQGELDLAVTGYGLAPPVSLLKISKTFFASDKRRDITRQM